MTILGKHEMEGKKSDDIDDIDDIDIIEILLILSKNKTKIILFTFIFSLLGFFISLMIPNIYRANTKLLPPQQSQSSASAMLSQLSGLAGGAGAALGIKNPNELYISLLKSRKITDKIIERFDLKSRYDNKSQDLTRNQLINNSFITSGKDGIISIDVDDKDPKIAAQIANAYVEELTALTSKFALTEAAQRRAFYEKQLILAKDKMIAAENLLSNNIPNTGLISVDGQSKAVIETTAKLRANISAKEIQLKAMQAFITPNSTQFKQAFQELSGMKDELSKLESGPTNTGDLKSTNKTSKNPNFDSLNSNGANNFQLLRDVKYYQMLYEMLTKQFEIARLDEAKDTPIIQVLDPAVEPEKKYKPQRILISFVSGFFGLIIAVFFSFFSNRVMRSISEEKRKKIEELKKNLRKI